MTQNLTDDHLEYLKELIKSMEEYKAKNEVKLDVKQYKKAR